MLAYNELLKVIKLLWICLLEIPLCLFLSRFGYTELTAYLGLKEIGNQKLMKYWLFLQLLDLVGLFSCTSGKNGDVERLGLLELMRNVNFSRVLALMIASIINS